MGIFRKKVKKSAEVQEWSQAQILDLGKFLGLDLSQYDEGRLSEITYFACLKTLSEAVAKLPLTLQRVTENGGVEDAVNSPFYNTVRIRPNPYMTPSSFLEAMENSRNHYGNAYARIIYGSHKVELYPLSSEGMTVKIPQNKRLSDASDIIYDYVYPETGENVTFGSEEILHFKTSTTFGGIIGLSVREKLSMSLDGARDSQAVLNEMYKNNMTGKAVVQYAGNQEINSELSRQFVQNMNDYAQGKKGTGQSFIPIPYGTTVTPLSLRLADEQFLELRKYTALQIASAFGIKPNQLNDYEKASYANSEAQQLAFYAETMLSILKQYEEELNFKLLTAEQIAQGYRFKFNVAAVLRGDTKAQVESLCQGISSGLYTPNEARRCLDLPSKDGGDRIYFNGSNIAVEDAGAQYGTNGSENSPETAGSAADRQQENTKALLRLAESIEKAGGCGIIGITKYSDSQPRDDHGRWTDGGGGSGGGSGGGASESGISGKHESANTQNSVDLEYLKSEEYKNKFKGITGNAKVDEQLYQQSKAILTHRNGTDKEDLCLIDSQTGKIVGRQSNSKIDFGVEYNSSIENAIKNNPRGTLISIHNHPTNNPPTGSDFVSNGSNGYKLGIAVTHNGKVFTYKAGEKPFSATTFGKQVDKYRGFGYTEYDAIINVLNDFSVEYGIEWSER